MISKLLGLNRGGVRWYLQRDTAFTNSCKEWSVTHDVDDYLQEWEERRERGESVSASDLCADWPEDRTELARLIGLLEACDRLLVVEEMPPVVSKPCAIPAFVAGYEVRGELGCGGMGVVYRVWDPILRREAALKMLKPAVLAALPDETARLLLRFQQEAQVLAQLNHEYIVPVFEARVADGQPFFVMECVVGGSLATRLSEMTTAGPKVIVPFVEKVARAVQHAHSHGVLHRDLKPANILLEWRPGEGKGPVPRVSDFGLAKLLSAAIDSEADTVVSPHSPAEPHPSETGQSRLTVPGVQPGTPAYMAPEQFDPAFGGVGPATDVWALGVVLYQLLTGQKPFRGSDRAELHKPVCQDTPTRPRSIRRTIDRRLEAIVLRCLSKKPERRFQTASELADALAKCAGKVRRHRWAAAFLIGLTALAAGVLWALLKTDPDPAAGAWAAGAWAALPKPNPDPEDQYQRAVALQLERLERGEAVELIPPGDELPPYRVRWGGAATEVMRSPQGVAVQAPAMGVVEFLPRVPCSRFRIQLELQHDRLWLRPANPPSVGIVFCRSRIPSPGGTHHIFGQLFFDEWNGRTGEDQFSDAVR